MITFLKANGASAIATCCDFLLTTLLVSYLHAGNVVGSVAGVIFGGIVHFSISRLWVFKATDTKLQTQAVKYLLIWSGNIALHALGMYLLADVNGVNYMISKAITTAMVFVLYNYPMHKKFVFKTSTATWKN